MKHDPVNRPKHYTSSASGIECIQITEHMNFCLGNAIKYLWRVDEKEAPIEDLKKAIWYIQREVERREHKNKDVTAGWAVDQTVYKFPPRNTGYGYDGIPYWWKPSWPTYVVVCVVEGCSNFDQPLNDRGFCDGQVIR